MAKVGFWLQGAKGKLAGASLQKGEKGTVARQLVVPKNPQTSPQMLQRIAFGTVTSAAKFMLGVIGIAMEGYDNKKMGRREFIRINVNRLKTMAREQYQGVSVDGAFIAKGYSQLVPNSYIISKGSLPQPLQFSITYDGTGEFIHPEISASFAAGTYTADQLWQALYGLKAGQQLTRCAIFTINGDNVAFIAPNNQFDPLRYSRFFSDRLVLKEGNGATITISNATTAAEIHACLMSLVDTTATAGSITPAAADYTVSWANDALTVEHGDTGSALYDITFDDEVYSHKALGYFVSEFVNNQWCYSNGVMCAIPSWSYNEWDDNRYGLNAYDAIQTYLKKNAVSSDKYTQQGGDEDTINGSDF